MAPSIYVVTPPGKSKEDCEQEENSELGKLLRDANVLEYAVCVLSDESVCLLDRPANNSIYIFDDFSSSGFFHFCDNLLEMGECIGVISPIVWNQIKKNQQTLTDYEFHPTPVYSLSMRGAVVCFTGFKNSRKQRELESLICLMNGIISDDLSDAVTHVVAATTFTLKCIRAKRKNIPIMTETWIRNIWDEQKEHSISQGAAPNPAFAAQTFHNVRVCASSVTVTCKTGLMSSITSKGGVWCRDLMRNGVDVLVSPVATGEKYRHAREWNIKCVTPDWVTDSVKIGIPQETEKYSLKYDAATLVSGFVPGKDVEKDELQLFTDCLAYLVGEEERCQDIESLLHQFGGSIATKPGMKATHLVVCGDNVSLRIHEKIVELGITSSVPYVVCEKWVRESVKDKKRANENCFKIKDNDAQLAGGVFSGLTFDLSSLEVPEKEACERIIGKNGGTVVSQINANYKILPVVYRDAKRPCIKETCYTTFWLEDCLALGKTSVPPNFYHKPLHAHKRVEEILGGVVATVRSYSRLEQAFLTKLLEAMGARCQDELLNCSHLISRESTSVDAINAKRAKIQIVTHRWVFASFQSNKMEKESQFRPDVMFGSSSSSSGHCEKNNPSKENKIDQGQEASKRVRFLIPSPENPDDPKRRRVVFSERSFQSGQLPASPAFLLSSFSKSQRAEAVENIEGLNGRVVEKLDELKHADAIIAPVLIRNEKVLTAIAGGKFLLKPEYLSQCHEKGSFIPISKDVLWTEENSKEGSERALASAGFSRLNDRLNGNANLPMSGMKVYVAVQKKEKAELYHRLVRVCGGEIVESASGATCIIKDPGVQINTPHKAAIHSADIIYQKIIRI